MEVLLRGHGGDGGVNGVLVRSHTGHDGAAATPLQIGKFIAHPKYPIPLKLCWVQASCGSTMAPRL